jgi:hypothetical protein
MDEIAIIVTALATDSELIRLLGSEKKIIQGNLSKKPSCDPSFILISTKEGIPLIESDEGIVVEKSICTIEIIAEEKLEEIKSRIKKLMEGLMFRGEMIKKIPSERPEWKCLEMSFARARLLQ